MSDQNEGTYEDANEVLTAWAESDAPRVRPGASIERGAAAAEAGRVMLTAAIDDSVLSLLITDPDATRPAIQRELQARMAPVRQPDGLITMDLEPATDLIESLILIARSSLGAHAESTGVSLTELVVSMAIDLDGQQADE